MTNPQTEQEFMAACKVLAAKLTQDDHVILDRVYTARATALTNACTMFAFVLGMVAGAAVYALWTT